MQGAWREAGSLSGRAGAVMLLVALALCGMVAGSEIRATPCTIESPGGTADCVLVLDRVSPGLSEFEVKVTLGDPATGEITAVRFPSWAGLNSKSKVPSDSVILKGSDTGRKVGPGSCEVVLATLTIRGDTPGTCGIDVEVIGMRDEVGSPYTLPGKAGTLVVREPLEDTGNQESTANPSSSPLLPQAGDPMTPLPTLDPISLIKENPCVPTDSPTASPDGPQEAGNGSEEPDKDAGVTTGTLCVDSDPRGAQIFVDGQARGVTPLCLALDQGTHHLSVSAEGYFGLEGEYEVPAGQVLHLPAFVMERPAKCCIIAGAGAHGSVYPSGCVEVGRGGSAEFVFHADPGYRLDALQIDGVWYDAKSPVRFEGVTENHTLWGEFSPFPAPMADFAANRTEGYAPFAVRFDDLSVGDISGTLWEFGDNTTSFESSPVHRYSQPGTYTVSLEVCGAGGCNLTRKEQFITVREKEPLTAGFLANTTSGAAPLHVQFQDNSTGNPDSWSWDFGDGATSTEPSPCHLYPLPGVYTVRLVICAEGCMATADAVTVVNVHPQVIGGSVGFFQVMCSAEGAHVFLDGRYMGAIENGTLNIPVYVTAAPARILQVRAEGFLQYYTKIADYPGEGETIVLDVPLQPLSQEEAFFGRFQVPTLMGNLTISGPSLM